MKLYLIGGFIGSGKTTAIYNACGELSERGVRVGVITNDQGTQLVDTGYFKDGGISTMEVSGGCFCCNYIDLEKRILSLIETNRPEVIFAESVGSCTDLVATVIKPLQQFYPQIEIILSVFVDCCALPSLIKESRLFSHGVNYIYKKQIEEADILVVNKIDLLTDQQMREIKSLTKKEYPSKVVIFQSSIEKISVQQWLSLLNNSQFNKKRTSLELDYDIYGTGEAELGWLDAEIIINSSIGEAMQVGYELIKKIYSRTIEFQFPIGHLKFLMNNGRRCRKISLTPYNLHDFKIDPLEPDIQEINMVINARVQAAPDQLEIILNEAIKELENQSGCNVKKNKISAFKPGYPKPTYRILD